MNSLYYCFNFSVNLNVLKNKVYLKKEEEESMGFSNKKKGKGNFQHNNREEF